MNELKNNNGYVVLMKYYPSAEKLSAGEDMEAVYYGGVRKRCVGETRFSPYKTEQSAGRGRKAWEAWCEDVNELNPRAKYQVEDVIPLDEKMFQEIKEQDFEIKKIISKIMSSMLHLTKYGEKSPGQ